MKKGTSAPLRHLVSLAFYEGEGEIMIRGAITPLRHPVSLTSFEKERGEFPKEASPLFDSRFYLPLEVISILKGEEKNRGFVSSRHSNGLDYL
jgi:hypothetical protein